MRGDELPRPPPVVPVRRAADVGDAVHDDVGDQRVRPGREHVVVRAQHRLGGARRRHDDDRHGAEAEEHEVVAVLPSEASERDVRERADEVEVPEDGQRRGGRR